MFRTMTAIHYLPCNGHDARPSMISPPPYQYGENDDCDMQQKCNTINMKNNVSVIPS